MKNGTYFGIDFGTTNTAVVKVIVSESDTGKTDVQITNLGEEGNYPFSSIVAIPRGMCSGASKSAGVNSPRLLFGRAVKRRRFELSKDYIIITSIKTMLNKGEDIKVRGGSLSALKITAAFLKYVKRYLFAKTGSDLDEAVFAVPIDFTAAARAKLASAAAYAGIKVTGFVYESTAAYIANRRQVRDLPRVMVVDWGGGTIDVSIIETAQGAPLTNAGTVPDKTTPINLTKQGRKLREPEEDEYLLSERAVFGKRVGGDDLDTAFARRLHAKLSSFVPNLPAFEDIRTDTWRRDRDNITAVCEQIKLGFSDDDDDMDVTLRNYCDIGTKNLTISYRAFMGAVYPVVEEALRAIDVAMEQSNLTCDEIDGVILVGGSCQLRVFRDLITKGFGDDNVHQPKKMQWSVAEGAAVISALSLMCELEEDVGEVLFDGGFVPLIRKGTVPPYTSEKTVKFVLSNDDKKAGFIFTNRSRSTHYGHLEVPTEGVPREEIQVRCLLRLDGTATFYLKSGATDEEICHNIENLKYCYSLPKSSMNF
ncbi:hypothetical protein FACS1894120_2980 [Clostridia bacterium]|nr:hypothetical protein FACS1894120_2980 [Clostridia bacterium]